jgi:hypothetical protein
MKKGHFFYLAIVLLLSCSNMQVEADTATDEALPPAKTVSIPFGGNAFVTQKGPKSDVFIDDNGLENWSQTADVISCYFKVNAKGSLKLWLQHEKASASATIQITVLDKTFSVNTLANKKEAFIGEVQIKEPAYVKVDLKGVKRSEDTFAQKAGLLLGGSAIAVAPTFADDPENFYFSRRGPSCHLNYTLPNADIVYFYSELQVPTGQDNIGSYFMANGFDDGYFGIQVNSATERRVLFSVWEADNQPKTLLLKKGPNVQTGRFDGEGTGGQSYLLYPWKAGISYKFLTKGVPDGAGNTIYTSWFFVPEINDWQLIASFKRQNKSTYITNFSSFIENFEDRLGYTGRKAFYTNQWVQLKNGQWQPIKEITFSIDETAQNKQRLDYNGGIENGKPFLQNGGFINTTIAENAVFKIENKNVAPQINVE